MCSIVFQLLQARHRKREKVSQGTTYADGYDSRHEKKFWHRGRHHENGVPNGGANGTTTGTATAAGTNGTAGEKQPFWKFGRHNKQPSGGAANGYYPDGVPGQAAEPPPQTATYGTGAGAGSVPPGGPGYSYVNSAPGYNVQPGYGYGYGAQPAQPQYGASNF